MPRVKKKDKAKGSKEAEEVEDADETFSDCERFHAQFNEDSEDEVMPGTGQDEIEDEGSDKDSALGGSTPGPMKKRRLRRDRRRPARPKTRVCITKKSSQKAKAKAGQKPKAKRCKAKAFPKTRVRIMKKGSQKAKEGAKKKSRAPRLPAGVSLLCIVYIVSVAYGLGWFRGDVYKILLWIVSWVC